MELLDAVRERVIDEVAVLVEEPEAVAVLVWVALGRHSVPGESGFSAQSIVSVNSSWQATSFLKEIGAPARVRRPFSALHTRVTKLLDLFELEFKVSQGTPLIPGSLPW